MAELRSSGPNSAGPNSSGPNSAGLNGSSLRGSRTHANLTRAFADGSQVHRRYAWFAEQADIEGLPEIAGLFRSLADGVAAQAHGHLEFLAEVADPMTGLPIGETVDNLRAAIAEQTDEATTRYPAFAEAARAEGFDAIADWFETLAVADADHVERLRSGLGIVDGGAA